MEAERRGGGGRYHSRADVPPMVANSASAVRTRRSPATKLHVGLKAKIAPFTSGVDFTANNGSLLPRRDRQLCFEAFLRKGPLPSIGGGGAESGGAAMASGGARSPMRSRRTNRVSPVDFGRQSLLNIPYASSALVPGFNPTFNGQYAQSASKSANTSTNLANHCISSGFVASAPNSDTHTGQRAAASTPPISCRTCAANSSSVKSP
mmetsp:Transcript_53629/g.155897  ORF Transcript_53629/g.155897 Transcript_53629/m.155897 type:complete len:207 (-) Transcript_53629:1043-1663(-)